MQNVTREQLTGPQLTSTAPQHNTHQCPKCEQVWCHLAHGVGHMIYPACVHAPHTGEVNDVLLAGVASGGWRIKFETVDRARGGAQQQNKEWGWRRRFEDRCTGSTPSLSQHHRPAHFQVRWRFAALSPSRAWLASCGSEKKVCSDLFF